MIVQKTSMPLRVFKTQYREIEIFEIGDENIDAVTVKSFGEEWKEFHQFSNEEIRKIGDSYFDIITDKHVDQTKIAVDFGCGSGRWTKYLLPRVKKIVAIDPSDAIFSADHLLGDAENVELCKASISDLPFSDNTFDFGFSLGVLHHIPDTAKAMKDCVKKIKPGGYFLVYLYYSLDNRGVLFRYLFHLSNFLRKIISKLPQQIKSFICTLLAVILYMPFVLLCRLLKVIGVSDRVRQKIPLYGYENTSFYIIRNDSLDRFGTPLERRFSRKEIEQMMKDAGLTDIVFSERIPYWHAVGKRNN